jgi:hypothetical protein
MVFVLWQPGQLRLHCVLTCYSRSGYVCMVFYKRDGHVIELQQDGKYCLLFTNWSCIYIYIYIYMIHISQIHYLNWVELNEIGQYIQYNKNFDCKIQSCHSRTAMYNLLYEYYKLLHTIVSKVLQMYIIWSWLYCAAVHDISFS